MKTLSVNYQNLRCRLRGVLSRQVMSTESRDSNHTTQRVDVNTDRSLYVLELMPGNTTLHRMSVHRKSVAIDFNLLYQSDAEVLDYAALVKVLGDDSCSGILPMMVIADLPGDTLIERNITLEKSVFSSLVHQLQLRWKLVPAMMKLLMNSAVYRCALTHRLGTQRSWYRNQGSDTTRGYQTQSSPALSLSDSSLESASTKSSLQWCLRLYSIDSGLGAIGWSSSGEENLKKYVQLQALVPAALLPEVVLAAETVNRPWVVFVHVSKAHCRHSVFRWGRLVMTRTPVHQSESVCHAKNSTQLNSPKLNRPKLAPQINATIDHMIATFDGCTGGDILVHILGVSDSDSQCRIEADLIDKVDDIEFSLGTVHEPGRGLFALSRCDQSATGSDSRLVTCQRDVGPGNVDGGNLCEEKMEIHDKQQHIHDMFASMLKPGLSQRTFHQFKAKATLDQVNCLPMLQRTRSGAGMTGGYSVQMTQLLHLPRLLNVLMVLFFLGCFWVGIGLVDSFQRFQLAGLSLENIRVLQSELESKIATHQMDAFLMRRSVQVHNLLTENRSNIFPILLAIAEVVSRFPDVAIRAVVWNREPRVSADSVVDGDSTDVADSGNGNTGNVNAGNIDAGNVGNTSVLTDRISASQFSGSGSHILSTNSSTHNQRRMPESKALEAQKRRGQTTLLLSGELKGPCESASLCYSSYEELVSQLNDLQQLISVREIRQPFDRVNVLAGDWNPDFSTGMVRSATEVTTFSVLLELQ